MRILYERHLPPKYVGALESRDWATLEATADCFPPGADDSTIAEYAEENDCVVLTRDRDFFELAEDYDIGILYLDMFRIPKPGALTEAIATIDDSYSDHSDIAESVPGDWI
jgi:predicted nuclease of predicted toxin-antitoxin system